MKTLLSVIALFALVVMSATAEGEQESPAAAAETELMEISWLGPGHKSNFQEDNAIKGILEEKYNVKLITPSLTNWKDKEKFLMLAAADDLPDVGMVRIDQNMIYQQGITRSIPGEMIKRYAPKVARYFDKYNGWEINRAPDNPDEYIGFGALIERDYPAHCSYFRLDWLENVGIEPNGELVNSYKRLYYTTTPFDLEQLKRILIAFAQDDPDGDGTDNTWGMDHLVDDAITGAFGCIGKASDAYNHYEDGELKMFYAMDAYKEYLKYMAELYAAGAIDPDAVTGESKLTLHQKWAAGWNGYRTSGIAYADPDNQSFLTREPMNVFAANPDAKLLMAPYTVGPDGTSQYRGTISTGTLFTNGYFTYVNANVDDAKLARILQMFDDINADLEFRVLAYNGEAGVDFDWEGEPYDSTMIWLPDKTYREPAEAGLSNYVANWFLRETDKLTWRQPQRAYLEYVSENLTDQMVIYGRYDIFNETDLAEVLARYMPEQEVIFEKYTLEAMTGEIDIDATWGSYLEELNANGYDEIIDAYMKTTDVREFIQGE